MRNLFILAGLAGFSLSGSAMAQEVAKADAKVENKNTVTVEGKDYPICSKTVSDGCINPREAGLKYGNVPLSYWPGKPASEMSQAEMQAAKPKK